MSLVWEGTHFDPFYTEMGQPTHGAGLLQNFGAVCLDVGTSTVCQLGGFPSNHQKLHF